MALDIPKEPKVYTTKYRDFRGVDYTNDPSNVWYRRSPNGLNMLPDLDGKPYKRKGWKVEMTSEDFCDAANVSPVVDVTQYKVDYFELEGTEWLVFFTSIGLFFYDNKLLYIDEYEDYPYRYYNAVSGTYAKGDYTRYHTPNQFYKCVANSGIGTPKAFDADDWVEILDKRFPHSFASYVDKIDYNKSFFFEGNDDAGYYIFADDDLFMFDGDYLRKQDPYIPTVLVGCEPDGTGTLYQSVNLLGKMQAVQYFCDGVSDTFTIPQGFATDTDGITTWASGILLVQKKNNSGKWVVDTSWSYLDSNRIKFTSAPAVTVQGEDNLRVVYIPEGASVSETTQISASDTMAIDKDQLHEVRQERKSGTWRSVGNETVYEPDYTNNVNAVVKLDSVKQPAENYITPQVLKKNNTTWSDDTTRVGFTIKSYGKKVAFWGKNWGQKAFDYYAGYETSTKTYDTHYSYQSATSRIKSWRLRTTKSIKVRAKYTQRLLTGSQAKGKAAFLASSKVLIYGNGIANQVFVTASNAKKYNTRVWWSAASNPLYFPDTNYIEVGATDKRIVGLLKVDDYLGIVKQGSGTDTAVYLAYPTSFSDETTYAVKQTINGVGALSNGAFNILNDEPLFLSAEGVMGIEPVEEDERKIRNRSFYINKPLKSEAALESAVSFIYDGMYWLAVDNHVYVLDGSQKVSWENTKTNLQYEAYYLENVPAKCFAKKDGSLWFINDTEVCRFKTDSDDLKYVDDYSTDKVDLYSTTQPTDTLALSSLRLDEIQEINDEWTNDYKTNGITFEEDQWKTTNLTGLTMYISIDGADAIELTPTYTTVTGGISINASEFTSVTNVPTGKSATYTAVFEYYNVYGDETKIVDVGDIFIYGDKYYTVLSFGDDVVNVGEGVPIHARWGTIADDDGSAHYLKNLQKKGSLVAFMPDTGRSSLVYLKKDEQDIIYVGKLGEEGYTLPFHKYLKKKMKKYKRLQIVCENNEYDSPFGIDEIIKSYTIGNYAKK